MNGGELEGTEDGRLPVRFDHGKPARVIPAVVAEQMLMDWHHRNPAQFGYWLAAAMTGAEPAKTARKPKPEEG